MASAMPPELASTSSILTGGAIGSVIVVCGWLMNLMRSAAKDGAALADDRISWLMADFKDYRERAETAKRATDATILAMRTEMDGYRQELVAARAQLRECRRESHELRIQLDDLRIEVHRLHGLDDRGDRSDEPEGNPPGYLIE